MNEKEKDIDLIHGSLLGNLLLYSLPLIFSGLLQLMFNAADTAVVGKFTGSSALAAASAATLNLDTFCYVSVDALGQGILTFTAQNYGAGNFHRIRLLFRIGMISGITIQLIPGIICYVFSDQVLSVFSNDPEVLYYGKQIMLPICVLRIVWIYTIFPVFHAIAGLYSA